MTLTGSDAATFVEQWRQWHLAQERRIGDRHGFLAVTNIHWLTNEPQRFTDAPGAWTTDKTGVHVVLDDGEGIVVEGDAVHGHHDFGVIPERGGVRVGWNDAVIEVAKRGGYDIVRPRHPDAPLVSGYRGTPAFEPDPRWAVAGRYVPFDSPRPTPVAGAVERVHHVYDAPGRVEFEIDDQSFSLTVFASEHGPGVFALFTDETSGVSTYAANRGLQFGVPGPDGDVAVDFNRATNLPCAYTDLATCPLPPAGNHLPIPIEAGEKTPYERLRPR
jgi:uncharacterized protein (DUF1684 family)